MVQLRIRKNKRIEVLRKVALFHGCNAAELGKISSLTTEYRATAGEVLTKRGQPGLEAFVIVEGSATATRKGRKIARLGPGSLFGELALLDGEKRTATVVADGDMVLLVLSRREFSSLLAAAPSVATKIICELGARLRRTDEMLDPIAERERKVVPLSV